MLWQGLAADPPPEDPKDGRGQRWQRVILHPQFTACRGIPEYAPPSRDARAMSGRDISLGLSIDIDPNIIL